VRQRPPRREDLVNVLEFEEVAKLTLPPAAYATIAGSTRAAFDRITLRPRMLIPTLDLDLSVEILGEKHFAPVLPGPVSEQRRYHADGELATVRGASAAKATMIASSRSSVAIAEIVREAKTPLWSAVYTDGNPDAAKHVQQAVAAGCKAICLGSSNARLDWKTIDQLRRGVEVPVVIKGIMTAADAKSAAAEGVRGIVVSDHGAAAGKITPIEVLPSITDAVGDKVTVLIDGSFRRGSDILKALILGARGVLIARPAMWGLAAYGADGVQSVIEMLQSDLGRHIAALGVSNIKGLTRSHLRIHRR
jgi:4-hydroxymandelate oxidase